MLKRALLGGAIVLASSTAMADGLIRDILSSGITTGTTYLTFRDHKLVAAARDDAQTLSNASIWKQAATAACFRVSRRTAWTARTVLRTRPWTLVA